MSKRILLLPVFFSLLIAVLSLRLVDLQIVQGSEYRRISENNRFFRKRIPAPRGVFFDRFGEQMVYNKPAYFILDEPDKRYSPMTITTPEIALPMLASEPERVFVTQFRDYAQPVALSQVLGYVGVVSKEDLENNRDLRPEQQIGKTGAERVFERELKGVDGEVLYETNARGEIIREISRKHPEPGENVDLSLDMELTAKAYAQLDGKKGVVIVGDGETGELLALASSPTFDANTFTHLPHDEAQEQAQRELIRSYFNDSNNLFFNHALSGAYPPGSVFKLVTAISGLELDAFDADTIVVDEGVLKVDEYSFGNWYYRQFGRVEGPISLVRAIARSNDIYFYKAAEWIGPDKLADSARMMGFGEKTEIELPAEARGTVPDPAWKEKVIGERWYLGNTYHYGIGQGDLLVTPVQVFQMTSLFANDGKICSPTLVKGKMGNCKELSISQDNIDLVRQGMIEACSTGGTAFPFFQWNEEKQQKVACKTGTAEFGPAKGEKGYRDTHGWFTAVIELPELKDYPRKIVMTVLIESDEKNQYREGSKDAAPIAFELAKWIEEHR